jgi:DNA replication protein DnaC
MRDKLRALIAQLRLHGMADTLDAEIQRAEREAIAAPELLYRLLGQEAASRRERSLAYRLAQARLPWRWSLDSFPFDRQPGVSKAQIQTLAGLDFLRRADNVLLIGKPGTGKTGLAIGLLREACLNGYRGRFTNAQVLLDELYASLADRTTTRLLAQLSRMQPLLYQPSEALTLWDGGDSRIGLCTILSARRSDSQERAADGQADRYHASGAFSNRAEGACRKDA